MSSARSVNEHDIEPVLLRVHNCVSSNVRCIFSVPFLEKIDFSALALAQLLQVPHVHAQLLDGAGAERVCSRDEDAVVVLEEEEGDFGEVGGFTDAVYADDGEDVGAGRGRVGLGDFAEEVEGGGGGEDFGQGFFHGDAQGRFDCYKRS